MHICIHICILYVYVCIHTDKCMDQPTTTRETNRQTDGCWGSWGARFKARIERMIARLSQYLLSGPRALAQQPLSSAARLPDWQQPQTPTRPAGLAVEHGTARTPEPGRPPPNPQPGVGLVTAPATTFIPGASRHSPTGSPSQCSNDRVIGPPQLPGAGKPRAQGKPQPWA